MGDTNKVWIPLIGIYYAYKEGGFIFMNPYYLPYQQMCFILFLLAIGCNICNKFI